MKNTYTKQNAVDIRQKATELLKEKQMNISAKQSESDSLKLIHELEVHQIELELVNEEIKLAVEKSELIAEKYTNLYDFATSGYYTLTKNGNITELNLQGAKYLNKERSGLINSNFTFFLSNETKLVFNQFLEKLFSSTNKETCEVTIITNNSIETFVNITGIASENGENCFITVIDISNQKNFYKLMTSY